MNNLINFKTFFGFILLSITANSYLSVHNYESLPEDLKDPVLLNISYSVGNFGFVPYIPSLTSDTAKQ